jgi:hypothetical protein
VSVWDVANKASDEEGQYAGLGVQALQSGRRDPAWFFEEAGRLRAVRYEFEATARALAPLWHERLDELRQRREARLRGASA